ncbi:hypothetical protein [Aureispira sp. CCB-QB1]|uniref:hypothetical protein n=1 Tax=Aureispira sp. CCB-QB1 TaxID=1313421 RepID=UPI0006982AAE|nr:hypothetical protein [Aureispira sp. CCB-QB1]
MNTLLTVAIICPKCNSKASYFYSKANTYRQQIVPQGKAICSHCAYINPSFHFSNNCYYYKIQVKNRFLYARNREGLQSIMTYFEQDKRRTSNPDLDFPKLFYQNRLVIIQQIKKLLDAEQI